MKQTSYLIGLLLILVVGTQSCAPTQHIREANNTLPLNYNSEKADTLNDASTSWRIFFQDSTLTRLIDSALIHNQELNIFLQQVVSANNEIQAKKGEYLPFVGYQAGTELDKVGEYTRDGAVENHLPIRENESFPTPFTNYQGQLTANWEIDVWKKLRNHKKAAIMEYLATNEAKKLMTTHLVTEIAQSYYELEALDNQINLIIQNLSLQQNALKMARIQKQAAQTTQLAVQRFEGEVLKNQSELFIYQQKRSEVENKLNYLLGRNPQPIKRNSDQFLEITTDSVLAGVPAQLLNNRPDIKQAEYELEAAKLDVKVARANFYPSIGLRAGLGLEAFQPQFLVPTPEALMYNLSAELAGPLINRKAIKAAYNNANARQLAKVFEYEKTILTGYIEVLNSLSKIENLEQTYQYKRAQVKTLNNAIHVSTTLFQSAHADYMEVLLTQREALESKMELIETKKDQLVANINLYRALGGGWK